MGAPMSRGPLHRPAGRFPSRSAALRGARPLPRRELRPFVGGRSRRSRRSAFRPGGAAMALRRPARLRCPWEVRWPTLARALSGASSRLRGSYGTPRPRGSSGFGWPAVEAGRPLSRGGIGLFPLAAAATGMRASREARRPQTALHGRPTRVVSAIRHARASIGYQGTCHAARDVRQFGNRMEGAPR
jgi:hypothetical protein